MAAPLVRRVLQFSKINTMSGHQQFLSPLCLLLNRSPPSPTTQFPVVKRTSFIDALRFLWRTPNTDLPYSIVDPQEISPIRTVPDHIVRPPYAETGKVPQKDKKWSYKDEIDIKYMRKSCRIARKILDIASKEVKIGVTTDHIDKVVHDACIEHNCYPSTLNYNGFPKSLCTSVNNVMVHGIPDSRPLEDGDIINLDVTVYHDGYHGDVSETCIVGNVDDDGIRLIETAKKCRDEAIKVCKPNGRFMDIGITIAKVATEAGFYTCPSFMGHGIGKNFHETPDILHHANRYTDIMKPGMVFTIEPVIADSKTYPMVLEDEWTVVSSDNERSAQFEHTILITETGVEVLTKGENEDW
ncbi:methionine aminopeptidase 1D, mitochondrial-like [Saccoglossus kowalevskii]|uniref:Methionine aminopeptidase n=1 Tax=Saccoglossus kowalevskii TaxID=10224 RepID=A0ABM0H0G1_SACKO|nr:PREDICTED: methionine aminopeptidase 1D, mitochondrial-like [Saccoglossus kowalevskii]